MKGLNDLKKLMPEIDENGYKAQSIRTCLKIYGSKENE
jgi:hypothetical protein